MRIIPKIFLVSLILFSCKKENKSGMSCFPNSTTIRRIIDSPATIKETNGEFYIIEQAAIDTKLNPCNLAIEFQINNLEVTVSGDVKATVPSVPGLCCTENFVITKISR